MTQTILVLRFSSLGDCILISGAFDRLRELHPQAKLWLATKKQYAGLYEQDDRLSGLLLLDSERDHNGIAGLRRFAQSINEIEPDLIIDLHGTLRARVLKLLLKLPGRIRTAAAWRRFPRHTIRRRLALIWPSLAPRSHITRRFNAAVSGQPESAVKAMAPHLQAPARERRGVALIPGAAWQTKQWPLERFVALSAQLLERGVATSILGGSKESDMASAFDSLSASYPELISVTMMDQSLLELRSQLASYQVTVANDTGLMHLADAVGTPVIALFGPTAPKLGFTPQGRDSMVVHAGTSCSPCTLRGTNTCPKGHFDCMNKITVSEISNLVHKVLDA